MKWLKRRRGDDVAANAAEATTNVAASEHDDQPKSTRRRISRSRAVAYGLLPAMALLLASAAGFLKFHNQSAADANLEQESVRAATDGTVALLSYRPETVQKDLHAARGRLTGTFLETYTELTDDVVIPGAQQKQISASATVSAAASTTATATRAVVLLFVDQAVTIGKDAPTNTASSVRVTLDRVDDRWLISQFDPV
jgi:Mce-associated membrane protein